MTETTGYEGDLGEVNIRLAIDRVAEALDRQTDQIAAAVNRLTDITHRFGGIHCHQCGEGLP